MPDGKKIEQQPDSSTEKEFNINKPKASVEAKDDEQVEQQVNRLANNVDATISNAEIKAEIGQHKSEVAGSLLDRAKEQGGKMLDRTKDHRKELMLGTSAVVGGRFGLKRLKNKLFSDDKKTEDEVSSDKKPEQKESEKTTVVNIDNKQEKSRRQKAFPRLAVGTGVAGAGYFFRDKLYQLPVIGSYLDKLFNPAKLNFDEAIGVVKSQLNNVDENHLKVGLGLERDEKNSTIKSFGESVKVNLNERTIDGMDIKFSTYEELIHTANIINSAKTTYKGICENKAPFYVTSAGGDIEAKLLVDKQNELISGAGIKVGKITGGVVGSITALAAGYYLGPKAGAYAAMGAIPGGMALGSALGDSNDTLSQICPSLNSKENKSRLVKYINDIGGRTPGTGNIENAGQTNNENLNKKMTQVLAKIRDTSDKNDENDTHLENSRQTKIENYNGHKDIFKLHARDRDIYLKVEVDDKGDIIKVTLEDSKVVFTGPNAISEALHLGLFVNKMHKELQGKAFIKEAFKYQYLMNGFKSKDRGYAIGFATKDYSLNNTWLPLYQRELSKESIEKNIPQLLEKDNMKNLIGWLNLMRNNNDAPLWKTGSGDSRKNTFLENLDASSKQTA